MTLILARKHTRCVACVVAVACLTHLFTTCIFNKQKPVRSLGVGAVWEGRTSATVTVAIYEQECTFR
jgi:hypothetical protein